MNLNDLNGFDDFAICCCNYFNEKLSEVKVSIVNIVKNNNSILKALQFKKDNNNIAPTIYLESYYEEYEEGRDINFIFDKIEEVYRRSIIENVPDFDFINDYRKAKDSVFCRVINTERNINLLEGVPHVECMDLSIVFYVTLNIGKETGTVLIRNEHISNWNQKFGIIYQDALKNTKRILGSRIYSIEDVLIEMFQGKDDPEALLTVQLLEEERIRGGSSPMYVLSNSEKYYGAACILDNEFLDDFSKKLNSDFYILPSSIHELIVVPDNNKMNTDMLKAMVTEVNATQVSREDYLSDNVYKYVRNLGKVVPV